MMAGEPLANGASYDAGLDPAAADPRLSLSPREALGVFEEEIDFSLNSAVPDPVRWSSGGARLASSRGRGSRGQTPNPVWGVGPRLTSIYDANLSVGV